MSGRLNIAPYPLIGASVSYLHPIHDTYAADAQLYDVDPSAGEHVLGIGADYPDVVLTGTRAEVEAFVDALAAAVGPGEQSAAAALAATHGYWGEHAQYLRGDWQCEVAQGDTLQGYWEWVAAHVRDGD